MAEQVKSSEQVGGIIMGSDGYSLRSSLAGNQQLSRPQAGVIWDFEAELPPALARGPLPSGWLAAVGLGQAVTRRGGNSP